MKSRAAAKTPELKEATSASPDLAALRQDFVDRVQNRGNSFFSRQKRAFNTRHCKWPGKSDDGRKWRKYYGEDVFPHEGASDVEFPLADLLIKEDKAMLLVLLTRMRTLVQPVEANDAKQSARLTSVVRWMFYTQMTEQRHEAKLAADYFLSRPGGAVVGTFWVKEQQLGYEEMDLETLQAAAAQAQQALAVGAGGALEAAVAALPLLVLDPAQEATAVETLGFLLPDVPADRRRGIVKDLRTSGHARFVRAYVSKNRPVLRAYAPNEDIFIDPEASDLQDAAAIDVVELITESQLREREHTMGWKREWINRMLESQRGALLQAGGIIPGQRREDRSNFATRGLSKRFQVVHTFRRLTDPEGVPGLYYTCWSPGLTTEDLYAWHGLLGYDHGEYPFVQFAHDLKSRNIDDCRSYPETMQTWQNQGKASWDQRIDVAGIRGFPPLMHPPGEPPPAWGPGVQFPSRREDAYRFLDVPAYAPDSQQVEESVRAFADRFVGRRTEKGDPQAADAVRQNLADDWMAGWQKVITQVLQLCQQFLPDEFYYRVVGSAEGQSLRTTREEIQGKFDLTCGFNIQALDVEWLKMFNEFVASTSALDRNGIQNPDAILQVAWEHFDPNLGERILKPGEGASAQEAEDEATRVFPSLMAGVDVPVKPGQAYALRLKTLDSLLMQPGMIERVGRDPVAQERVEKRRQRLAHQLEQFGQNAFIGQQGG